MLPDSSFVVKRRRRRFCRREREADDGSMIHVTDDGSNRRRRYGSSGSTTTTSSMVPPSWSELEIQIGESYDAVRPISIDTAIQKPTSDPSIPPFSTQRPTLFRERHGWCPYSERAWLALEMEMEGNNNTTTYDTVRIDNTGGGPRPDYFTGQTPQIRWPESTKNQGESMDIVNRIDQRYNEGRWKHDDPTVCHVIAQFGTIFPRRARPSSRAAFLFQHNGEPLGRGTFERTLRETDDLLPQSQGGPYFVGDRFTAADMAWLPFLERYRYQLPCLHAGLDPNDPCEYPYLAAWYKAVEELIPAYACRVKGDAASWRKVLSMAGFGNAGVPPQIDQNMVSLRDKELQEARDCIRNQDLWTRYAAERNHVADTPAAEAARIITANRRAIIADIVRQDNINTKWKKTADLPFDDTDEMDETLREMVDCLLRNDGDGDSLTNASKRTVGSLAAFLDERMCVPRDMGCMSAATIKLLAWNLQTYN